MPSIVVRTMQAQMTLAEAATLHPDGTVSMLRAGINHLWGQQAPFMLEGSLVVRLEADITEQGPHKFEVRCVDEDGRAVLPALQGQFRVPQGGGSINLILGLGAAIQKAGRFTFCILVDNVDQTRWTLNVSERKRGPENANEEG